MYYWALKMPLNTMIQPGHSKRHFIDQYQFWYVYSCLC